MRIPTKPLVALGLILFAYIIWSTGPAKIINTMLSMDLKFLVLSMFFPIPVTLLKAYRWKKVVSYLKKNLSLVESIKVWLIGLSASTVTPSKAGDVIRGFYLNSRTKLTLGKSISTVVIDRLFDIISMAVLATMGVFILVFMFNAPFSIPVFAFLMAIIILVLVAIVNKGVVKIILKPFYRFFVPQKYKNKLKLSFDQLYIGIREIATKKRLAYLFTISIFSWGLTFVQAYFILLALHVDVPLIFLTAVLPIEILVSLIPITVSGFGTRELTLIFFFSLIGVAPEIVVSFSLIGVLFVWATAAIGFVLWMKTPIEIKL